MTIFFHKDAIGFFLVIHAETNIIYIFAYNQNRQVPLFAKISSVLSLFEKYLAIYHSFALLELELRKIEFVIK